MDMSVLSPEERVKAIFDNIDLLWAISQHHHFYLQKSFVDAKTFKELKIVPIDNVNDWLGIEKKDNTSTNTITVDMLTKQNKKTIMDIYNEDYEFFNLPRKL